MITPLKLVSGNDDVTIEDQAGAVCIDIQPWRDQGASADLDFGDALGLLEWLTKWVAASSPA